MVAPLSPGLPRRTPLLELVALAATTLLAARGLAAEPPRVLVVGNSHTYVNDLPGMLRDLAAGATPPTPILVESVAVAGATLYDHREKTGALERIRVGHFTTVVLQPQSQEPASDPGRYLVGFEALEEAARQSGARVVLVEPWARGPSDETYQRPWSGGDPRALQAILRDATEGVAREHGAVVAPVGGAWELALGLRPAPPLFEPDDSHATVQGTYLAACTLHAVLSGKSPVGNGFRPDGMSVGEARVLQRTAERAVAALHARQAPPALPRTGEDSPAGAALARLVEAFATGHERDMAYLLGRLEAVAQHGDEGAAAIEELLVQGNDVLLHGEHVGASLDDGNLTSCPSLRAGLLYLLGKMGGEIAVRACLRVLEDPRSLLEADFAARSLELVEPGRHRDAAVGGVLAAMRRSRPWVGFGIPDSSPCRWALELLAHHDAWDRLEAAEAFALEHHVVPDYCDILLARLPAEAQVAGIERLLGHEEGRLAIDRNGMGLAELDYRDEAVRSLVTRVYRTRMTSAARGNFLGSMFHAGGRFIDEGRLMPTSPVRVVDPERARAALSLLEGLADAVDSEHRRYLEQSRTLLTGDTRARAASSRPEESRESVPPVPPAPRRGLTPREIVASLESELAERRAGGAMAHLRARLAELRAAGDEGAAAIAGYLDGGRDLELDEPMPVEGATLAPLTVRRAMIDTAGYIPGRASEAACGAVLAGATSPAELALAARCLERIRPGQSRREVIDAIRRLVRGLGRGEPRSTSGEDLTVTGPHGGPLTERLHSFACGSECEFLDFFEADWLFELIAFHRATECLPDVVELLRRRPGSHVPFAWFLDDVVTALDPEDQARTLAKLVEVPENRSLLVKANESAIASLELSHPPTMAIAVDLFVAKSPDRRKIVLESLRTLQPPSRDFMCLEAAPCRLPMQGSVPGRLAFLAAVEARLPALRAEVAVVRGALAGR